MGQSPPLAHYPWFQRRNTTPAQLVFPPVSPDIGKLNNLVTGTGSEERCREKEEVAGIVRDSYLHTPSYSGGFTDSITDGSRVSRAVSLGPRGVKGRND